MESPPSCAHSHVSVENVAEVVVSYSRGALMAKIDIESAYRLVLVVHPSDHTLQAVKWEGKIYIDPMLLLAYTQPQSCLMQWQMNWNGS